MGYPNGLTKIVALSKKKIIIDTDAGVDDAIAIMMALGHSDVLDILAIITVTGNTSVEYATQNVHYLLKACHHDQIPIYDGESHALHFAWQAGSAAEFHGPTGLGFVQLEPKIPMKNDGVQTLLRLIKENPNETTIVCLGPLTNVAKALQYDPDTMAKVKEIVLLGGTLTLPGNITSSAEFNIYSDPEAADSVFKSSIKKTMVPITPCNDAHIHETQFSQLESSLQRQFLSDVLGHYLKVSRDYGENGTIYDTFPVSLLTNPSAFTVRPYHVDIEKMGEHTRGMTVIDYRQRSQADLNVDVVTKIDRDAYLTDFMVALNQLGQHAFKTTDTVTTISVMDKDNNVE